MKRIAVFASLMLPLIAQQTARASELKPLFLPKKASAKKFENLSVPEIHVVGTDWGDVRPEEIEALLNLVAQRLLVHFPGRKLGPIIVSPSDSGPVSLYRKGPDNAYQIRISAKDRRWAEYVYEFSHEFFHLLAHYERHAPPRKVPHQWFEEALCEVASLYTLKQLSLTWEQSAPRPEWVAYKPQLIRFTDRALGEEHRRLPYTQSFAQWFRANGASLSGNPYLRNKNELVANLFLPIFEETQDWSAIAHLNDDAAQDTVSFRRHLMNWYQNTPGAYRGFVVSALHVFRFDAPLEGDTRLLVQAAEESGPLSGTLATGAAGATRH